VISSNISEVVWAADGQYAGVGSLYVVFHGGRIAGYRNVPATEYANLISAPSVGSYYAKYIRGKYTGRDGNVVFAKAEAPSVSALSYSDALASDSDVALSVSHGDDWGFPTTTRRVSSGTQPLTVAGNKKQRFFVTYTTTVELYADDFGDAERQVLTDGSNVKVKKVQKV
jgi:hypothetical protein